MGIIVVPTLGADKANYSYTFSDGKPAGMYEDGYNGDGYPTVLSGNNLREVSASHNTRVYALAPAPMKTTTYRAQAVCGNLSAGTSRGMGVAVGGSDGAGGPGATNLVFLRALGQDTANAAIWTKVGAGALEVSRASGSSNTPMAAGRTLDLAITFDGTYYTYTGYYQGSPITGCTWTDTTGIIGTPGPSWGCMLYGQYNSGYFSSLGCYGISAYDL